MAKETLAQAIEHEQVYRGAVAVMDRYLERSLADSQKVLARQEEVAIDEDLAEAADNAGRRMLRRGYSAAAVRAYISETTSIREEQRTRGKELLDGLRTQRKELHARAKAWLASSQQVRTRLEKLATRRNAKELMTLVRPFGKALAGGSQKPETEANDGSGG
ncbi:MAG TPA: hypothetical protein VD971_01800 [Phycisphaerales bacterium]|nr:hypothetical protein [Phycisphaerales bacterium]